ncbi:glycosyltransferase [Bacteroides caecicola]|uniref:glycosyltransferase n=1 Tax=Bacteroides caecicola TaxID=1462569 RepID=UPI00201352E5|nr:glycosyltransferase [Bacteroides caecicola]MCL1624640.1 glycosyltransferase [Bacteroides caecicola]
MKKKVTIITENLYGGGVQRILQIICNHFDYERYNLTVYSVMEDIPRPPFYPSQIHYKYIFNALKQEYNIVKRIWIKIKNKWKLFVYYHCTPKMFYQLFINEKTDVAIAFIEGYATRIVAGFPKDTKRIAWLHTDLENNPWTNVAFRNMNDEQKSYNNMDCIVCVSNVVQNILEKKYIIKTKTQIIYNPIDRERIIKLANKKNETPYYFSIKSNRIISIGALINIKGYERLIKIAKRLVIDNYQFELLILGKGPQKIYLENLIKENNLTTHVQLIGYQNNPYPFLQAADIYVCSSYAEGYNTAITEALILGKAVVSTECSGVKEQLGENNDYGICTQNSEEDLYEGIKKMLNPNTLSYYTRKAQERGQIFTLEKSMSKIYNLIED